MTVKASGIKVTMSFTIFLLNTKDIKLYLNRHCPALTRVRFLVIYIFIKIYKCCISKKNLASVVALLTRTGWRKKTAN